MKMIQPLNVKIHHTYDYEKFKLVGVNRKVDQKHVQNIADSIMLRNLLHLFPVIVNKDFEVMDGQHRLGAVFAIESARELQLPVYYIMDPSITLDDISLLNSNKVNWKNIDYINFYALKGNQNYIEILDFMKKYPMIPMSSVVEILSTKRRDMKIVKEGNFLADRVERAYFIMECVIEISERTDPTDPFWKSGYFIQAMKHVISTKKYQHHVMMASARNNREHWNRNSNTRSYIIDINKIYNWHLPEHQKIDFIKLTRESLK